MRPLIALTTLLLLPACDWVVGPEEGARVGVIAFYHDPVVVSVPGGVDAGAPFEVSIRTYGDGCMREGSTEVAMRGGVVDVTPYDVHSGQNVCTDILNVFEHVATLTLSQPGQTVIRFHGLEEPGHVRITVDREVTVR